ncbi:hypothetical protein QBC44DRAFT_28116 [Cladorrhinum sp. PSN332]|nr:hypothetical protein QBC44DRAFT_28116 [Cladorrhinum sp. PSN332]
MSGTGILKIIKTTKRKYHSLRRRLRMAAPLWPTTPPSPPSPTLVPVPATRRARFLTRRSNARSKRPGRAPHAPQLTSSSSSSDLAGSGVAPLEPGLASSPLRGNPEAGIARVPPRPIDPNRTRSPFLSLPGEIRNEIYSYLAQYPTCQELYAGYNKRIDLYHARKRRNPDSSSSEEEEEEEKFPEYVRERELRTPTILLLCKAVTQECMPMLKAGTFVVDHLPPWRPGELRPMRLTEFISEGALQSLRRIEVYVQLGVGSYGGGWVWSQYFKDIVAVLCRRNSFDLFGVAFSMHNPSHHFMWLLEDPYLYRMGLEILQLKNHNPRWWVSMEGKVEAGWWVSDAFFFFFSFFFPFSFGFYLVRGSSRGAFFFIMSLSFVLIRHAA